MIDYISLKQNVSALLNDLGFSLDKILPLVFAVFIIYLIINKKVSPIKKIEAFIIRLCGAIESGGDIRNIELYSMKSPIQLTPKGIEVITQIGFKRVIDDNLDFLIKSIDNLKPKTALDVEQNCIGLMRYMTINKQNEAFKGVEDFLYNNPTYNNPEVFKAAGIYLRNKYLEKNPSFLPPATP